MKFRTIYTGLTIVGLLAGGMAMSGCSPASDSLSEAEQLQDGDMHMLLNLSYDGDELDDNQQHEGSDNILNVANLDFLFYTTSGAYVGHAGGHTDITLSAPTYYAGTGHRYQADIRVQRVAGNATYRVVVLANWRDRYSNSTFNLVKPDGTSIADLVGIAARPAGYSGSATTDEEYLYDNLLLAYNKAGDTTGSSITNFVRHNLNGEREGSVPMWGVQEMTLTLSLNTPAIVSSGTINLLRSIAKVKIELGTQLKDVVKFVDPVLKYKQTAGYMAPLYSDIVSAVSAGKGTTWNSQGKDWNGSKYIDTHTRPYLSDSEATEEQSAPLFYDEATDAYYIYLPEQKIKQSIINFDLVWKDPSMLGVQHSYKLHFADYEKAKAAAKAAAGASWVDRPLTDSELDEFEFPVMRNHYYTYTITNLNPMELKFEVCPWMYRSTDIDFGYLPSKIEEILGFTGYAFRYTHTGSELHFWVKGNVTNPEAHITDVYVDGNQATLTSGEYATGLCYWKSNKVNVRYTVRFRGVDYVINRTETIS